MNKLRQKISSLLLSVTLVIPTVCWGEGDVVADYTPGPLTIMREAGVAVTGRVFGMKDQGGEIRYYEFDLTERTKFNSTIRSLFVPGWGQAFNDQKIKGGVLFFSSLAAAVGSAALHEKSKDSFDEYEAAGKVNGSLFDDYEREHTLSLVLGSGAALIWLYSVIDANRNTYTSLYESSKSFDIVYLEDGAQVILKQKF